MAVIQEAGIPNDEAKRLMICELQEPARQEIVGVLRPRCGMFRAGLSLVSGLAVVLGLALVNTSHAPEEALERSVDKTSNLHNSIALAASGSLMELTSNAKPGHKLVVPHGTALSGQQGLHGLHGSADKWITIEAYGVVIDGNLQISDCAYLLLKGIEVKNSDGHGIRADNVRNLTLYKVRVHHHKENGIQLSGKGLKIDHSEVHNVALRNMGGGKAFGWPQCIGTWKMSNGSPSEDVTIVNNLVHHCWGEGIDVLWADKALVASNYIWDVYSANVYVDASNQVTVERNYIKNVDPAYKNIEHQLAKAFVVGAESGRETNGVYIHNNIVATANMCLNTYAQGKAVTTVQSDHNTCWGTWANSALWVKVSGGTNKVTNNIFVEGDKGEGGFDGGSAGWHIGGNVWARRHADAPGYWDNAAWGSRGIRNQHPRAFFKWGPTCDADAKPMCFALLGHWGHAGTLHPPDYKPHGWPLTHK